MDQKTSLPVRDSEDSTEEIKLPKSFRESKSQYKSDIAVHALSLKHCCSVKMATFIQKLGHIKAWYPPSETLWKRFPADCCYMKAIEFVDAKTWNGVASVIDFDMESTSESVDCRSVLDNFRLVCRVLIARTSEPPTLMYFIHDRSTTACAEIPQESTTKLVKYALGDARKLKKEFLKSTVNRSHQTQLFHLDVEVQLIPGEGEITTVWDSTWENSQTVAYPPVDSEVQYSIVCNGLAERLLKTRSTVKDRYGEILIEHLTEAQAKMLLDRNERVLIVNGKSGTGKTIVALHLVQEALRQGHTSQDGLYICSSEGLMDFINSQVPCHTVVLEKTDSLSQDIQTTLQEAKLVIVDDVHAMSLGDNWEENPSHLYKILFTQASNCNCEVAIFFDAEQDYQDRLPPGFEKRLRSVAEATDGMLPEHIKIITLTERIRNSQEISRFMQANQSQAKIPGTISCLSELSGDGIVYEYIGGSVKQITNILNAKLDVLQRRYKPRSIAILCDESDQFHTLQDTLKRKFGRTFQEDRAYPIQHTVMCKLDDFMGLEADVVLFLFVETFVTDKSTVYWKYINFISSRAKLRLEFLLLRKPVKDKERNLTNFLELFNTVSRCYGSYPPILHSSSTSTPIFYSVINNN